MRVASGLPFLVSMQPPILDPIAPAASATSPSAPPLPLSLVDYDGLGSAARRLDELAEQWDASAVVAVWTEPGDLFVTAVGTAAAVRVGVAPILAWAARELADAEHPVVRWRMLDEHDNLLRRDEMQGLEAETTTRGALMSFVTPRGGRGRLAVLDVRADPAAFQVEALMLALRLPATLQRERDHEARLRAVLAGMRAGAVVVGSHDDLRFVNRAAQRSLELDDEAWNTPLAALVDGNLADLVAAARHAHGQVSGEFEGPHGPMAADVSALDARRPGALLLQLHDRGERRRVERLQNEFVGTIGHELKTPLTSARTALELLTSGEAGALGDDQQRMLDLVVRNLTRLEHLVHQLLDTARQRVGRLVLQREERLLGSVLETVLEAAHRAAQRSGRNFEARIDPRAVAFVDDVRFGEIVENLVNNALKFTPARGHVQVRVRAEMPCPFAELGDLAAALGHAAAGCEVEVGDDGPGMDPLTQEHAFEAFFQDGDPLADRPSGAGLGLAIVRSLVDAHDGQVELDSELEEGTRARVWVPGSRALARTLAGVGHLRRATRELLRQHPEALLELAPLSPTAEADLTGLDHVDGNEILLVRLGDAHIARLSAGPAAGAPLPRARCAPLGKDAPRIGTTLAQLARELPGVHGPLAAQPDWQEEPRP